MATGPEVEQYFAESHFERLQIHCATAAYQISRAQAEKDRPARNEALAQATAALNKAISIDVNEQLPVLGLGQVALLKVVSLCLMPFSSFYTAFVGSEGYALFCCREMWAMQSRPLRRQPN